MVQLFLSPLFMQEFFYKKASVDAPHAFLVHETSMGKGTGALKAIL